MAHANLAFEPCCGQVGRDGAARAIAECQTMYTHAQDPIDLSLRGFKPRGGQPPPSQPPPTTAGGDGRNRSVFVSQLPWEATMLEVKSHFARAGIARRDSNPRLSG